MLVREGCSFSLAGLLPRSLVEDEKGKGLLVQGQRLVEMTGQISQRASDVSGSKTRKKVMCLRENGRIYIFFLGVWLPIQGAAA